MTATESTEGAQRSGQPASRRRRWLWPAVVPVLAVGWWLGAPLFVDDRVDEAFPIVSTTVPGADEAEIAASEGPDVVEEPADDHVVPAPEDAPIESEPLVLVSGSFEGFDAVHQGSGAATFYELGGSTVLRFESFEVTNGPDLRVNLVLSDGSMIDLGALKGNVGDQNYEVPDDLDLISVESVLIYCRAFSVPFAQALLG